MYSIYLNRGVRNLCKNRVVSYQGCMRWFSDKEDDLPALREKYKLAMRPATKQYPLGRPWNERYETWKSAFSYFRPEVDVVSPDLMRILQTPIDYSPRNLNKWYTRKQREAEISDQKFIEDRQRILGTDLAAAHFIVHRGGAVKFAGEHIWVKRESNGTYKLPSTFVSGLFIEAIDAKGMTLHYEGLVNLMNLDKLIWLSFEGLPHINDWCVDAISAEYKHQLEHFDISHCPNISHRCLACFYRFEKLRSLKAEGLATTPEFKYSFLMLEEILPTLKIEGVDYSVDPKLLE